MSATPDHRPGRRQLVLVASIFLAPLAAAVLLYFSSDWRPAADVSGELIEPPVSLPAARLVLANGEQAPAAVLRERWFLVHLTGNGCDDRCIDLLEELGRVRLALDKDASRVRRVLLHAGACCGADFPLREPDLLLLGAPGPDGRALRASFPPVGNGDIGIYIVDPHGNLMMGYPPSGSARGLLKDLERLLRLSKIG
jgi:hypothetical protein